MTFASEAVASVDNADETDSQEEDIKEDTSFSSTNRGTLILDATCCPADIHYPTDVGLLNHTRELLENMIDILHPFAQKIYPEKPRTYRQVARKAYLGYAKKRKHTIRETRAQICEDLQYIRRDIGYIQKMVDSGALLEALGTELYRKLLVIQELARQQWEMYLAKKHTIEDRIVSIDQPHIRPIVRGKAGVPVEFGEKFMVGLVGGYAFLMKAEWNNYVEGSCLKEAVEEYRQTFGFYPKTILAYRAYPSRENKLWCVSLGIWLSGPRLGRKSATEKAEETKQIYRDGCERVAIEGEYGVVKRRYTLDHVMTKLPDTSMTSIAMGFFSANMGRKLHLLFAPDSDWAVKYDFFIGDTILIPTLLRLSRSVGTNLLFISRHPLWRLPKCAFATNAIRSLMSNCAIGKPICRFARLNKAKRMW